MKNRRFLILLAITMVIGMMPGTALAMDTGETEDTLSVFSDMPKNWSKAAIENAVKNGLLSGYNGKIMPKDSLTRAQMAAILNRAFGATEMASLSSYADVSTGAWYYADMAKAVQMKAFVGNNNKLDPKGNISRQEVFVVLARAFKLSGADASVLDQFSDRESISKWAKDGAAALASAGYLSGSNGKLNPKQNITRAEFAQIMDDMLKNYITKAGTYTEDMDGNVMISVADATLRNMKITGDLIIGDGVGDGDVTLDHVTITGRTVIRGGGVNSIIIIGNSNLQNIVIARIDGEVRVYSENGVQIGEVIVDGNDDVIIEGEAGTVTVTASDVTVRATNANIGSAIINGENSKIVVSENTKINLVTVNSQGADISGAGKINQVQANADSVTVSTVGTKVVAAEGTTGVMAGKMQVNEGNSEIVQGTTTDSSDSKRKHSSTSPLASYTAVTLTQTGNVADHDVQYQDAEAVIAALPASIAVTLENGSIVNVPVTWADTDTYSATTAGDYTFTAAWGTMPSSVNNNNNLAAPMVEVTVDAGNYFTFDSSTGTITGYNFEGGPDVIIPATIGGVTVEHIGESAFKADGGKKKSKGSSSDSHLTSVVIPGSVTSIGNYAFANNRLTSVTIPSQVTQIGDYAFQENRLTEINIPNSVTSMGAYAFTGCWDMVGVTIGSGVESIGEGAFYGCTGVEEFIVSSENEDYSSEDGVLFNKEQTTLIQFPAASSQTSYDIPVGVTSIGSSAFESCVNLTGITIPSTVENIGDAAFQWCANLTGLTIPNGVRLIGNRAFYSCDGLLSLTIPESVERIGESAFSDCSGLTDLTIEGAVGVTGTSIGANAFSWCGNLVTATLEDGVVGIGDYGFYHCYKLSSVTISDTVTSIGAYAFYSCNALTGITIPDSVDSIGSSAFAYCGGLTNVTVGDGIIIGEYAFAPYENENNFREVYENPTTGGAGAYSKGGFGWEKI